MSATRHCDWCGGDVAEDAGPCPYSFTCPTCGALPGKRCKRPSEHSGPMVEMHRARIDLEHAAQDRQRLRAQQLDLDGRLHDLPAQNEALRLFEPAATQLAGQTYIPTDTEETDR